MARNSIDSIKPLKKRFGSSNISVTSHFPEHGSFRPSADRAFAAPVGGGALPAAAPASTPVSAAGNVSVPSMIIATIDHGELKRRMVKARAAYNPNPPNPAPTITICGHSRTVIRFPTISGHAEDEDPRTNRHLLMWSNSWRSDSGGSVGWWSYRAKAWVQFCFRARESCARQAPFLIPHPTGQTSRWTR
jgi:hypothetical protein